MRISGLSAALACAFVAGAGAAGEPRIGKFVSYDAGGFTVITSRSGNQARQVIEDLAKFRYTLEKALGKRATNTAIPTQIVIVSEGDWHRYIEPRQDLAGWFQQGDFANYLALNGDAERGEAIHVVFHEYTHYFLASQFAGEFPPWFNEGLAEVIGFAKFDKGTVILQLPMFHVQEARDGDWIPFEKLIKVDEYSPEYQSHKLNPSFYAQSWLTVHYGLIENRAFGRAMMEYLIQLNALHPIDEAARSTFGDLAAVDQQLRAYSRNNHMNSGALKIGDLAPVVLPEPRPVSETDALAVFINLMLETRAAPDRIRPLLESLLRREPKGARGQVLAARLALSDDDPAAFEQAVAAAEALLAPDDWVQRRELAGVLIESTTGYRALSAQPSAESERNVKRAFKWYAEGVAKNSDDIELLWGFGTAAVRLSQQLDLAEQALTLARTKAPGNANISLSLANLKGAQGDYDGMIGYLEETERFANNISLRQWVTSTLLETRRYRDERKRVDEENRKQREEYERQVAEYEMKYGKKKKPKPSQ